MLIGGFLSQYAFLVKVREEVSFECRHRHLCRVRLVEQCSRTHSAQISDSFLSELFEKTVQSFKLNIKAFPVIYYFSAKIKNIDIRNLLSCLPDRVNILVACGSVIYSGNEPTSLMVASYYLSSTLLLNDYFRDLLSQKILPVM